jgi:hypothetical protein
VLLEITLRADKAVADPLADALLEAGALSVAIEDADVRALQGGSVDQRVDGGATDSGTARTSQRGTPGDREQQENRRFRHEDSPRKGEPSIRQRQ